MDYDPIKDRLGRLFGRTRAGRRLFFRLLDAVFLRAWYVRRELREIVRSFPAERALSVLDAGTGFGQYAYYLVRSYPSVNVVAVDVKEDYLVAARTFMEGTGFADRILFRSADLTRLGDEDAYDLILSVDVMEHIEDDDLVLRNFERALKPGGYVLINTPSNLGGSDVREEGQQGFIGEHVREGYAREDLEEKLQRAGLRPIRSFYTYGTPGSIGWRLLVKVPMKMLAAGRAAVLLLPLYYLPVFPVGMLLNAIDLRKERRQGTGLIAVGRKERGLNREH